MFPRRSIPPNKTKTSWYPETGSSGTLSGRGAVSSAAWCSIAVMSWKGGGSCARASSDSCLLSVKFRGYDNITVVIMVIIIVVVIRNG